MTYLFTYREFKKLNKKKCVLSLVLFAFLFMLSLTIHAQNVLIGLTSNGSIDGKGTAFSIKTNGTAFSVMKGFSDWGNSANGSLFKNDDGNFYGMTSRGGTNNAGTIFMMTPSGKVTMLWQFNYNNDGAYPDGELIKGPDGYLYGLTSAGGLNSYGTIFKISTSGNFSVIKHLGLSADGSSPHGHLTLASDGNFYGITYGGGSFSGGTVFKLTPGGVYSVIHQIDRTTEGGNAYGSLTEGKDGNLYAITYGGGTYNYGTIFKITKAGVLTVLKHLNGNSDGGSSESDLTEAKDGSFYGTCYGGGQFGSGTIFKITKAGAYTVVRNFSAATDGGYPYSGLMQDTDDNFYGITRSGGSKSGGTIYKLTTAGVYTVIHPIDYYNEGNTSSSVLVKADDGSFYAMTSLGGTFDCGIIFKTTAVGVFTLINTFNGAVLGNTPYSSFVKGKDSAYYCTTSTGGAYGYGSIVKICGGTTTALFSFNKSVHGAYPKGDLLLASDGNFYGMTSSGGTSGAGTIFKITPAGAFTLLHNLNGSTDGASPTGGLIQAKDGLLYGMTVGGGSNNAGTIFKISLSGSSFSVIKNFVFATDGGAPGGSLIQASDSNFYGMTTNSGRIFELTKAGVYTNLHTFNSSTDGYNPMGSLIQGGDGSLYGTCSDGGLNSAGTIFKMSLSGTFKTLRSLNNLSDGRMPKGSLLQGPDGMLYGTTSIGGTYNNGTVFKITTAGALTVLRNMNIVTDGGNAYGGLIFGVVNNLVADVKSINVSEDSSVKITLTGSGNPSLTYTVVNDPVHGKLTGTGNKLTYKPNKNYNGIDQFSYRVSTGCMASSPAAVTITVSPESDTPVLAAIGNKTVIKDATLKFKAKATDADSGQVLSYSLINAPAGAKINKTTGAFTWKPASAGSYTFKVRVTDDGTPPLYDEEQITVTVTNTFAAMNATDNLSIEKAIVKVNIFPNPVSDILHIVLPSQAGDLSVRIIDLKGRVVSSYTFSDAAKTNCDINVSKLANGMYLVQLQSDRIKETLKFMKN